MFFSRWIQTSPWQLIGGLTIPICNAGSQCRFGKIQKKNFKNHPKKPENLFLSLMNTPFFAICTVPISQVFL